MNVLNIELIGSKPVLVALLLAMVFLLGCAGQQGSEQAVSAGTGSGSSVSESSQKLSLREKADQYLNLAGVKNARVLSEGQVIIVEYDPREIEYEYELLNEWGKIFGTIAKTYPKASKVTIIQKYGGEKVFSITANVSDINAVASDRISVIDFKRRLEFKSS